jgi:hypothetical protein
LRGRNAIEMELLQLQLSGGLDRGHEPFHVKFLEIPGKS